MPAKKAKKQLTRGAIVELKAARLNAVLGTDAKPVSAKDQTSEEGANSGSLESVSELSAEPVASGASPLASLNEEISALRKQLAEKIAAYRLLAGGERGSGSQTVAKVVAMLSEPAGATKSALMAETGARKGYIDALLNRILPGRGHAIRSFPVDGARVRAYHITQTEVATE